MPAATYHCCCLRRYFCCRPSVPPLLLPHPAQITFREILGHYKRQAHAKQEVFRTVVLQQTDPHLVTQSSGDIIAFYNAVRAQPAAVCCWFVAGILFQCWRTARGHAPMRWRQSSHLPAPSNADTCLHTHRHGLTSLLA